MDSASCDPPAQQNEFNDTMAHLRRSFSDEGIDEMVTQEFEKILLSKLNACGNTDPDSLFLTMFEATNLVPLPGNPGMAVAVNFLEGLKQNLVKKVTKISQNDGFSSDMSIEEEPNQINDNIENGNIGMIASDENQDKTVNNIESNDELLNSADDISDSDDDDTDNVMVCQFKEVKRCKNTWKIHLSSGIMYLNGRDYIFGEAIGTAEW